MKEYAIGIDLGGTSIKYSVISKEGEFVFSGELPSFADISAEAVIKQLLKAIRECGAFVLKNNLSIKGIGIGTPGIVDEKNRIVLGGAENIKGWENIPLSDILEKEVDLPVILGNDANLMGLGETYYGAAKGVKNTLFITVGTGIGGAVVIDGKLFGGYANRGTELGHTPIIANGKPCACGSVGCLETYASTSAMVTRYIESCNEKNITIDPQDVNGKHIVDRYKSGDDLAIEVFEEHCNYLGHGIAGFVNIFSPQRVIIGGGLSEAGDFYLNKIREYASKYWIPDCAYNTSIVRAELGNSAGSMGACHLVFATLLGR